MLTLKGDAHENAPPLLGVFFVRLGFFIVRPGRNNMMSCDLTCFVLLQNGKRKAFGPAIYSDDRFTIGADA
jgi:hypothetical protein